MVHIVIIPNCFVILDDIKNADTTFGPEVPSLKAKILIIIPKPVVSNYAKNLKEILQLHKMVLVKGDIMFVNGIELLVSIYRHVKFTTVQYIWEKDNG